MPLFGNVGFVEALFFGLKAAVLAIVSAGAWCGSASARCATGCMIGIAAAAFVAIFFFSVPFPLIIIAAGVIGYLGARSGLPEFAAREQAGGKQATRAVDSLLGEETPDHVRTNLPRALRVGALWLLAVAGAGRARSC